MDLGRGGPRWGRWRSRTAVSADRQVDTIIDKLQRQKEQEERESVEGRTCNGSFGCET